uniref:F-box protein AT5G49610-like beta-propeller domain-containing protein n=2 Tax=Aegilops tauschii subsp. strangulata TaxID=200361 RepID=A0A453MY58_AEGTS
SEILVRLPPLPSSLPRAFLVCERWRGIVSDARFLRRFRLHHRRNPPLLGCFVQGISPVHFEPTLDAPNRVPQARFPFPIDAVHTYVILGCRHGLMLIFLWRRNQLLVWDPITGDRHHLDVPPGFDNEETMISGAVLRAAGVPHRFQVVLVGNSGIHHSQAVASVYSSDTGVWSNLVSTLLPANDPDVLTMVYHDMCSVMVGNSLYWFLIGNFCGILEFNLDRQSLSVIHVPVDVDVNTCSITVIRAEGGGLGFLFLSDYCVQAWKWKTDCDGVASWVLERTVALDKLLSMNSEEGSQSPRILGFAEDNNVVLLWTFIGVFKVQFESLQFKKLLESYRFYCWFHYYPFEGVYTADGGIGGGPYGAKALHNMCLLYSGC